MRTSVHFCPYPHVYQAVFGRFAQTTSCRRKRYLAREDGLLERRSTRFAASRDRVAVRGLDPRKQAPKEPPVHKQSLRFSVAARTRALVRDFVTLFRCSIPG